MNDICLNCVTLTSCSLLRRSRELHSTDVSVRDRTVQHAWSVRHPAPALHHPRDLPVERVRNQGTPRYKTILCSHYYGSYMFLNAIGGYKTLQTLLFAVLVPAAIYMLSAAVSKLWRLALCAIIIYHTSYDVALDVIFYWGQNFNDVTLYLVLYFLCILSMYSSSSCIVWHHSMSLSCDVTTALFSRLPDVVSIRRNQYPVAVSDPPGDHSSRIFSARLPVPSGVSEIPAPCQTKPRGSIGRLVTTMWWQVSTMWCQVTTMWWQVTTMWWFVTTMWWQVTTMWWFVTTTWWLVTTMWWSVTTMWWLVATMWLFVTTMWWRVTIATRHHMGIPCDDWRYTRWWLMAI